MVASSGRPSKKLSFPMLVSYSSTHHKTNTSRGADRRADKLHLLLGCFPVLSQTPWPQLLRLRIKRLRRKFRKHRFRSTSCDHSWVAHHPISPCKTRRAYLEIDRIIVQEKLRNVLRGSDNFPQIKNYGVCRKT